MFDQLAESRIHVVLKGTYESNSPRTVQNNFPSDDSLIRFSTSQLASLNSGIETEYNAGPSAFMLDIAEMRLNGHKFAQERVTYRADYLDSEPLFNGTGIAIPNDDVPRNSNYTTLKVFFRKLIFDNAFSFNPVDGTAGEKIKTLFHEKKVYGYDFAPIQSLALYDTLKDNKLSINRVFPLQIPVSGGFTWDGTDDWILEVRFVIKNNIKRYETLVTNIDNERKLYQYYGLADWLRDVSAYDDYSGGNVIGVARAYNKKHVATITGTVSAGSYVIAIPADDDIANYSITSDARKRPADSCSPRSPYLEADSAFDAELEYYVAMEKYKNDFITYVPLVNNEQYASTWNEYEDGINAFKIPPIVVYSSDGNFSLENVPVGKSWKLYYSIFPVSTVGDFPSTWAALGAQIDLTEEDSGGTVTLKP